MRGRAGLVPAGMWCSLLRSCIFGAVLGSLSSLMVNSALVEVSLSPFFATSFGLLFLTSAATVVWQLQHESAAQNNMLLRCFALLNALSGVTCFLLERDWSLGLSPQRKVPLYALLGMCLAFSVNFSALDLLARCDARSRPVLVRMEWQVRIVAITSVCTGALFGIAFGVLDVEDALIKSPAALRNALHREARICYPVGAASGAFASLCARLLEVKAEAEDPDLAYSRGVGDNL